MIVALLYMAIAIALTATVVIGDAKTNGSFEVKSEDSISFVLCMVFWPATLIIMLGMLLWESHQKMVRTKVMKMLPKDSKTDIVANLSSLTYQQLKTVVNAEKIGAIYLGDKGKEMAHKLLIDKSFEEQFLSKQ